MRLILLVFVSSILLAGTTATAGISTKRQDILKHIGTTMLPTASLLGLSLMEKISGCWGYVKVFRFFIEI